MNTPGIPEHADERAHKFYDRVYVGPNLHGADKHGYKMSWDSDHDDLKEVNVLSECYCGWCGNRPMPIQSLLWKGNYSVTGYTCVCKDAMDAVELQAQIEELEQLHTEQMEELRRKLPKHKDSVKVAILQSKLNNAYGSRLDDMLESVL